MAAANNIKLIPIYRYDLGPGIPDGMPGFCMPYPGPGLELEVLGRAIDGRDLLRTSDYKRSGAAQAALLLLYIFIPFLSPSGG